MIKKSSPKALSVVINQIRIANLLSLSILIGASSKISGAERTLLLFSQFWAVFGKMFLNIFNSSDSADCLEFNIFFVSKNILNGKTIALYLREMLISYLNTCKSTKFYLSSLIFRKWLVIFEIKIHP